MPSPEQKLINECERLRRTLRALIDLGVPVRVRAWGLDLMLDTPTPATARIVCRCLQVLGERKPERRWWPLLDLVKTERGLAEQCFPDAPSTVEEHLRTAPDWLLWSPITEPKKQS